MKILANKDDENSKNEDFDVYNKNNESKILELYQNFVEIQLENQRKEEIKTNAQKILKKLDQNRCPVWTLIVPWNHYTIQSLKEKNEQQLKLEISNEIARQKLLKKNNNSKGNFDWLAHIFFRVNPFTDEQD